VQPPLSLVRVYFKEAVMFEVIVALLTVLSVGIFAAHAVDAVRS
jgi:hypothetical protein